MAKILTSSMVWILAILSILVAQLVGGVALILSPDKKDIIVYGIMIVIQLINIAIVYIITKKRNFVSGCTKVKFEVKNTTISVLIAIVTFASMFLFSQYAFDFFVQLGVKQSEINIDGAYLILAIISTVILAPIGEELIYRYVICDSLQDNSKALAIIVSSICFTFMHMSPMQTVYQFALGIVLALIVIKTKNITCAIIVHATSNVLAIILSFAPIPSFDLYNPLTIIIAIASFVLGATIIFFLLKNMKNEKNEVENPKINKQEKTMAIITYALGLAICLFMWIANFF